MSGAVASLFSAHFARNGTRFLIFADRVSPPNVAGGMSMAPRDSGRIAPILEAIRELWQQHPDWTLGQLIEKVVATQGARGGIRAMDDDAMLMGIIELLHSRSKRSAGTP